MIDEFYNYTYSNINDFTFSPNYRSYDQDSISYLIPSERGQIHSVKKEVKATERTARKLLHQISDDIDFLGSKEAIRKMPQEKQDFITLCDSDTEQFQTNYLHHTLEHIKPPSFIFQQEAIQERIQDSIERHRFISGKDATHRFNTAIVGPPGSGKSTILQLYAKEAVLELIATGEWKNTFVFYLDMEQINFKDYDELYQFFVIHIFDLVCNIKPNYAKYAKIFQRYLLGEELTIPKAKPEEHQINDMINKIKEIASIAKQAHQPENFKYWINLVFRLPDIVPKALGFQKTLFIIDHFDLADTALEPAAPFESSNSIVFAVENLKNALSSSQYIIASKYDANLFSCLSPLSDDGIDLAKGIDFFTTYDIVDDTDNMKVQIEFIHEEPLTIDCKVFSGIPAYMMLWNELLKTKKEADSAANEDDRLDKNSFVIDEATNLIKLLFVDINDEVVDINFSEM